MVSYYPNGESLVAGDTITLKILDSPSWWTSAQVDISGSGYSSTVTLTKIGDTSFQHIWTIPTPSPSPDTFTFKWFGGDEFDYALQVTTVAAISAVGTVASSLSILLSSSTTVVGSPITVSGVLSSDGTGLSGKTVVIKASIDGGVSFFDVATLSTTVDGGYSASVNPTIDGTYQLITVFDGDATYSPSASTVATLTVSPLTYISSLTLSTSASTVAQGGSVNLTAVLTGGGYGLEGRTVKFDYSTDEINWFELLSGTTDGSGATSVTWTTTGVAEGNYYIRARFDGDSTGGIRYSASTSPNITISVRIMPRYSVSSITVGPSAIELGGATGIDGYVVCTVSQSLAPPGVAVNLVATRRSDGYSFIAGSSTTDSSGHFYLAVTWPTDPTWGGIWDICGDLSSYTGTC